MTILQRKCSRKQCTALMLRSDGLLALRCDRVFCGNLIIDFCSGMIDKVFDLTFQHVPLWVWQFFNHKDAVEVKKDHLEDLMDTIHQFRLKHFKAGLNCRLEAWHDLCERLAAYHCIFKQCLALYPLTRS